MLMTYSAISFLYSMFLYFICCFQQCSQPFYIHHLLPLFLLALYAFSLALWCDLLLFRAFLPLSSQKYVTYIIKTYSTLFSYFYIAYVLSASNSLITPTITTSLLYLLVPYLPLLVPYYFLPTIATITTFLPAITTFLPAIATSPPAFLSAITTFLSAILNISAYSVIIARLVVYVFGLLSVD